ncbi:hypothetical protein [Pseudomonas sp. C2B4]|uniref:DUF7683 domain-containing protein n=1 Tax=Pseudomonas sp. C2B4 TaxID=2735270 RepID=UPI001585EF3E|nr:hypothetical protein [Pseudomonas sp. C2B4]NUU35057.1 hypothetical protein [Pseudomonas sp. C2B4]
MRYVIEVFERETEELIFSVEISGDRREELKALMNWQHPEDEFDGYDLTPEQVKTLERWTNRELNDVANIVQLVCLE